MRLLRISLEMPEREFIFSCENEKEQESWISHLNQSINEHSNANDTESNNHNNHNHNNHNKVKNNKSNNNKHGKSNDNDGKESGNNISEQVLFMYLSKFEWNQLNTGDRLADLQEEFEDIADIHLVPPNQIKISVISQTWIKNNTMRTGLNDEQLRKVIRAASEDFELYNSNNGNSNISDMEREMANVDFFNKSMKNFDFDFNIKESMPIFRHLQSIDTQNSSFEVNWTEIIEKMKEFFNRVHGDIVKIGWLLKKMEWRNWKKRWCILNEKMRKLEWYESKNDDKCKGFLLLVNVIAVREINYLHFNGSSRITEQPDWIFEIETRERKIRFACQSKEELNDWMRNLQTVSHFQRRRASSDR